MKKELFRITECRPLSGPVRDIHKELEGCRCYPPNLRIGSSAVLKYEPKDGPGAFKTYRTAPVVYWYAPNEQTWASIETEREMIVLDIIQEEKK